MADGADPFSFLDEQPQAKPDPADPFSFLDTEEQTSAPVAFGLNAALNAFPAAASFAGAGAGATIGAPFGPPGMLIGGVAGGLAGMFGGSAAQEWGISALPDDWEEGLTRTRIAAQEEHPWASFLGGFLPFAITMKPTMGPAAALPANASAMQRIMANPLTARIFGGTLMGGMELGNEAISGESPDWGKVAVATGFGLIFNRTNALGEALTEIGARPIRSLAGIPHPSPVPVARVPEIERPSTVAAANDAKVIGPGVTEDVFRGTSEQATPAAQTAQQTVRAEIPRPTTDVGAVARRLEPDLFETYDALSAQADDLRTRIRQISEPGDEAIVDAIKARDVAGEELERFIASRGGYTGGPEARRLRATVRAAQSEVDRMIDRRDAFRAGEGLPDSAEMAALRAHLLATDYQMRDLAPDVSAAYRRAADVAGTETVEAPTAVEPSPAERVAPPEEGGPSTPSIEAQAAEIAANVSRELIAAGRPEDEAQLLGRLVASRYVTRASRLNGAAGGPQALYEAEGPRIRAAGARRAAPAAVEARAPSVGPEARPAVPEAPPAPVAPPPEPPAAAPAAKVTGMDPAEVRAFAENLGAARLVDQLIAQGVTDREIANLVGKGLTTDMVAAMRQSVPQPVPLMPTRERPTIGVPEEVRAAPRLAEAAQEAPPRKADEIEAINPDDIRVDAKRFQFKEGGDEAGVTERLKDINQWDPRLAGTAIVFRDNAGVNWIADGHQRLALAKRLKADGDEKIRLNAFVLNEAEGITDIDARAIAAAKNIAEGTGTAVDAAKVIRAAEEAGVDLPPLPPRSALVRDGQALARLSPEAFGVVVNDVVPPNQAAIVGRLVSDPAQQIEALRLLATAKPENVYQAELIVREMLETGTQTATQDTLFGAEAFAESVVLERAQIADEAVKLLRRDKATFRTLVNEAERIEGTGNVLDRAANEGRVTADERAAQLLTQLAFRKGPVSERLSGIARQLKAGEISRAAGAREFLAVVRREVAGGLAEGDYAGVAEPGATGERGRELEQRAAPEPGFDFETEPGADNLPQTLVPGVKPITEAERVAAQLKQKAGAPLRGGDKGPEAGGLFDTEGPKQRELFQPAPPPDTPAFKKWFGDSKVVDEEGNPLVVYHGTGAPFEAFDRAFLGAVTKARSARAGFFFTDNEGVAGGYGRVAQGKPVQDLIDASYAAERRGDWTAAEDLMAQAERLEQNTPAQSPHIEKVYLRLEKPRLFDAENQRFNDIDADIHREIAAAQRDGNDGLIIKNLIDNADWGTDTSSTHYLVFEPTQIKSVFNRGTFNAADDRILFQGEHEPGVGTIRVYHGSPHEFDRFDMARMGTGEGAQAYGPGLYFAENREVAATYRGRQVVHGPMGPVVRDTATNDYRPLSLRERMFGLGRGRLYTVDIKAKPEDFLQWDRPLSEQPPAIRDALRERFPDVDTSKMTGEQAFEAIARKQGLSNIWRQPWKKHDALDQNFAADFLKKAGVKGIRYLDQYSRPNSGFGLESLRGALKKAEAAGDVAEATALRKEIASQENPTHNYVVFNADDVQIRSYEQSARGSIKLADNMRPIITLAKTADASTFLHESGHQWLEELLRDAKHQAASDVLKADNVTVRKWLGMGDDQRLPTTRQHEKFARGFEQYMREGVAPSSALAQVFAKFKEWLTQIYQTLKGLGSPINDDIRGVFDRLIAEEPRATTVAPETERGRALADIHEADLAETPPDHAESVMDRVTAEIDRHLADQPKEVQDELRTAIARAIGPAGDAGAIQRGPVGEGGGGPVPVPAGGAVGGELGPVGPGGGPARAEGAPLPERGGQPGGAGERSAASEGAGTNPLTPRPVDLFGERESPLIDKAGNIRLENLTDDANVRDAIRASAAANNDFIGERRGVITDGQMMELADALGMDVEQLSQRKIGQAFNAEQIWAARKLLIRSSNHTHDLMVRANATGAEADLLAYAQAKATHNMIQGQVAGFTAEWGRAGRAFRALQGQEAAMGMSQFLKTATGRTLFQLRQEVRLGSRLETANQVSRFMASAQKRSFGSMVLEYWINALISGPMSQATYSVGNTIFSLWKFGPETGTAAAIGRIMRALGREGPTVRAGEVGAGFSGLARSLPRAVKASGESLKAGVNIALPGEEPWRTPFQPGAELAIAPRLSNADYSVTDLARDTYGAISGIRDGIVATGNLIKAGGHPDTPLLGAHYSPLGAIPDIAFRGVPVVPVGTLARIPGRTNAAIDSFFRTANYSAAKNALAYRTAVEEGLSGRDLAARIAYLRQNPTEAMMKEAVRTATDLSLMAKGNEFVRRLSSLVNMRFNLPFIGETQMLKFIDPFIRVSGNTISKALIERTPVGLLSSEIRADLMGRNGSIAQDTAMARMLLGSALAIGFGSLAAEGLLSGSGPMDRTKNAIWRMAGNQEHSVLIGDIWYSIARLEPIGMLAGVAADMYDVAHVVAEGDFSQLATMLGHSLARNVLDASFMRGPAELIQAVEDPGRYGQAYVRNLVSTFVPFSVAMGQIDRETDPYARQARSVLDAIKRKVPGLSETLLPRLDVWGEPIPNQPTVGWSAIYMQKVSTDPVNLALLALGIGVGTPGRTVRNVELTDDQYDFYAQTAGRTTKQRLDAIIRSSDWRSWDPETQRNVVQEVVRQSREAARGMLMVKYPDIVRQAVAAKLAPFRNGGE